KGFLDRLEIASDQTLNRPAVRRASDGRIRADRSFAIRNVELPAQPEQREALFQQKAIAQLGLGFGIEAAGGEVEETEQALAPAVGDFIENRSVSTAGVFWFDQIEIRGGLHFPGCVLRRLVDV